MKNRLTDLNDVLFEQLERLNDGDLAAETIDIEIKRSEAIVLVADKIVDNARLQLAATKLIAENSNLRLPATMRLGAGEPASA